MQVIIKKKHCTVKSGFFVKCCGVNNKEAYLDWIKNEKVLNPVLTF